MSFSSHISCEDCGFEITADGCLCVPAETYWPLLEDRLPQTNKEKLLTAKPIRLDDFRKPKKSKHA